MAVKRANIATIKKADIKPVTGKAIKKPVKKVKPLTKISIDKKKIIKKADKLLKKKPLTAKQKEFCRNYVIDWNGSKAYKIAYPNNTDITARVNASKLLTKTNIQEYCKLIQNDLEKLCGISKAKVLNEHLKLAYSSIAHLHNTWIKLTDFEDLTDDQRACISEISTQTRSMKVDEETFVDIDFVKIKLYDKQKALDSISKMLGYDAPVKTSLTDNEGNNVVPVILFTDFKDGKP